MRGLSSLMQEMVAGGGPKDFSQFAKRDKRELWKEYGHHFGSKEQAKQFYREKTGLDPDAP